MLKTILFVIILLSPRWVKAETILFVINDWCPYACEVNGEAKGILVDIVREIFDKKGISVSFRAMPLARGIVSVRGNSAQAMIGIVKPVAPDFIFPKEPVISTHFCFFTNINNAWSFKDLSNYNPLVLGVAYGKDFDPRLRQAFKIMVEVPGEQEITSRLLSMLAKGRIDAMLEDVVNVNYFVGGIGSGVRNAGCLGKRDEYVAFSPKNARSFEYATIFSDGVREIRRAGKMQQIMQHYIKN